MDLDFLLGVILDDLISWSFTDEDLLLKAVNGVLKVFCAFQLILRHPQHIVNLTSCSKAALNPYTLGSYLLPFSVDVLIWLLVLPPLFRKEC